MILFFQLKGFFWKKILFIRVEKNSYDYAKKLKINRKHSEQRLAPTYDSIKWRYYIIVSSINQLLVDVWVVNLTIFSNFEFLERVPIMPRRKKSYFQGIFSCLLPVILYCKMCLTQKRQFSPNSLIVMCYQRRSLSNITIWH